MPTCPVCHGTFARRKNEACPKCGTLVKLYKGKWYPIGEEAPNVRLLKYWEKLMSRRLGDFFHLPRKSNRYMREIRFAQDLLDEADQNIDLALRAMWVLFNDKDFSWKLYTSLLSAVKDWAVAIFIARSYIEKEEKKRRAEEERFKQYQEINELWEN